MSRKKVEQDMKSNWAFYKNEEDDVIWWVDNSEDVIGEHLFTFDKKKIYNLFADYPNNMTAEEVAFFDKENPKWAEFFSDRK